MRLFSIDVTIEFVKQVLSVLDGDDDRRNAEWGARLVVGDRDLTLPIRADPRRRPDSRTSVRRWVNRWARVREGHPESLEVSMGFGLIASEPEHQTLVTGAL